VALLRGEGDVPGLGALCARQRTFLLAGEAGRQANSPAERICGTARASRTSRSPAAPPASRREGPRRAICRGVCSARRKRCQGRLTWISRRAHPPLLTGPDATRSWPASLAGSSPADVSDMEAGMEPSSRPRSQLVHDWPWDGKSMWPMARIQTMELASPLAAQRIPRHVSRVAVATHAPATIQGTVEGPGRRPFTYRRAARRAARGGAGERRQPFTSAARNASSAANARRSERRGCGGPASAACKAASARAATSPGSRYRTCPIVSTGVRIRPGGRECCRTVAGLRVRPHQNFRAPQD
jgi:hypothetical protein